MILLPCLWSLASFFALPGTAGTLQVSDTTSSYVSRAVGGDEAIYSLDTAPRLALELRWKRAAFGANYGPRFTLLRRGADDRSFALLQSADAGLSVSGPRYQLSISYALSFGRQYLGNLVPPRDVAANGSVLPPPPADEMAIARTPLLPAAQVIRLRSQQATVRASYALTRRLRSNVSGSGSDSGGANLASRRLLPRQRNATAAVALAFVIRPRHQLSSGAEGTYIRTSSGFEHRIGVVSEAWTAQWTRITTSTLNLGVQLQRSDTPNGVRKPRPAFNGAGSLENTFQLVGRFKATTQLGAGVSPLVNLLSGELQMTARASASFGVSINKTSLQLALDGYQTLPIDAQRASRIGGVGLRLSHEVTKWLDLVAGSRVQAQRVGAAPNGVPPQWVVSAGLGLRAPPLRF